MQEWLCACAAILPAAGSPNRDPFDDALASNANAVDRRGDRDDRLDRLTAPALVAVHRAVVGLHTWALAIDGGQPRSANGNGNTSNNCNSNNTNHTNATDEYHNTPHRKHSQHNNESNSVASSQVDSENNAPQPYQRRPTSLGLAPVSIPAGLALNNNRDSSDASLNDNDSCSLLLKSMLVSQQQQQQQRPKKRRAPNGLLRGIEEEDCEYDSDAGKFTCAIVESSSSSSVVTTLSSNADGDDVAAEEHGEEIVPLRVEKSPLALGTREERNRSTLLCLGTFLFTCVLLYLLPASE